MDLNLTKAKTEFKKKTKKPKQKTINHAKTLASKAKAPRETQTHTTHATSVQCSKHSRGTFAFKAVNYQIHEITRSSPSLFHPTHPLNGASHAPGVANSNTNPCCRLPQRLEEWATGRPWPGQRQPGQQLRHPPPPGALRHPRSEDYAHQQLGVSQKDSLRSLQTSSRTC